MGKLIAVDRYFPIATETSCRNKWSWSTVYLNNGTTASCHRASVSDIGHNFDNFHNTDKKIRAREHMLAGSWPGDGCEHCKKIEEAGGTSDRQFQNQIPSVYPRELDGDPTLTHVAPVILEVFFSNTCNLKCVYCNAKFSSSIQQEDKKFGGAILKDNNFTYDDNRYQDLVPKFWSWFETNGHNLMRLQVLGGEPFVQKDLNRLVKHLDSKPNPKLEFNIVTNLSLPMSVIQPQIVELDHLVSNKKVKRVDILASVDCWGPAQHYIRHGFDSETFENNMNAMMDLGTFRLGLLTTITALSIPTMAQLVEKFQSWNQKQTVFWYMHSVLPHDTSIFSPTIFDYHTFEPYLDKIQNMLPEDSWDNKQTKDIFVGIMQDLKKRCVKNIDKQLELLRYLDENDKRRNINWKKIFPWLAKELEHVVQ